jgi:hypothetical protein
VGVGRRHFHYFDECQEGVQPDSITFVGVLNACANVVTIEVGSCAH